MLTTDYEEISGITTYMAELCVKRRVAICTRLIHQRATGTVYNICERGVTIER
mgnify:FL=1